MFNFRLLNLTLITSAILTLISPHLASSRQTVVNGTAGIGYDYAERDYDQDVGADGIVLQDDNNGDRRDYFTRVELQVESLGIHDTASLRYAPVLRYDNLLYTTDVDHYLTLFGERFFTKDWSITFADDYVLSNDPTRFGTPFATPGIGVAEDIEGGQALEAPDEITQNLGTRRFWTNDLRIGTSYTYAENSDVGFGYTFRVLRNDSEDDLLGTGYDEYDRHEFRGLWSHMFNPNWGSNLELRYIKGLYDDLTVPADTVTLSQDLEEYWADIGLDYTRSVNDVFPILYRYRATEYEDLRSDIQVHELSIGWNHAFDQRTRLNIAAGPSYVESDELDSEWDYNALVNFIRDYQHGNISALISKRFEPLNFTGSDDGGLSDIIELRIDATYQFTPYLTSTIFGSYLEEDILNPQGAYFLAALGDTDPAEVQNVGDLKYERESFAVGARLEYTFLRWFVVSLDYVYFEQDGDLIRDSYNDHRVLIQLSASKELWRK